MVAFELEGFVGLNQCANLVVASPPSSRASLYILFCYMHGPC
jgi:hypothetical protein